MESWLLFGMIDFQNLIGLLGDGLSLVVSDRKCSSGFKVIPVERFVFLEAKRFINST